MVGSATGWLDPDALLGKDCFTRQADRYFDEIRAKQSHEVVVGGSECEVELGCGDMIMTQL